MDDSTRVLHATSIVQCTSSIVHCTSTWQAGHGKGLLLGKDDSCKSYLQELFINGDDEGKRTRRCYSFGNFGRKISITDMKSL